ncbi:hypothetical protein CXQ85_004861 [Candidozyma haemuli]|uniref:Carboxypeptidase n=1 Tax=Candidozyma haemuli TaxID=45357 RepID=A0A2V1AZ85_9ASCO|nr:hypothetical protein CXQ85_004861 [[Candida] haemuloni]PVH22191.1 hypothetical protein CXQ85_004861 [[Candida] haemuloni]
MRISTFVAAACAASSASAVSIPMDRLQNVQQVLSDKASSLSSQYADIRGAWENKKGDVLSKIAQYVKEPIDAIPKDAAALWSEMMLKFPESVSSLKFKNPASSAKKIARTFDFHVSDAKLPNHKLRVKSTPEDLGIDSVKQYSGYLDVADEDKHFFFWAFESRNDPKKDPVILWLNGGPGCSSLTGLFFELGPARIGEDLKPVNNPSAWNNNATVIFLDQPVNVGYSYSSESVTNTVAAGQDVYAFLELFFQQFPQYAERDFHIAGESYGGHYIPVFSSEILSHDDRHFNLTSVLIGNGLTDPLTQYEYYKPMACGEGGEKSVLEPEECDNMEASIPRCLSLIESCYNSGSVWSCVPATIYCNNAQMGPYQKTGRNVYDIRTECKGGNLCYEELSYIDEYLNKPEVKEALGVEVEEYQGCNFDINRNFLFAGDWMQPYHKNVIDLLESGLPVLVYAGDKDFICNWLGNRAWTDRLPWSGQKKFESQPIRKWTVGKEEAGEVKNYEHFTFLRVYGGGHMVPFDQPENALDMVNRWIAGDFAYN